MKLVAPENRGDKIFTFIWGEDGPTESHDVPKSDWIVVELKTHDIGTLQRWLSEKSDRDCNSYFDRGRELGKREAYDRAWLVGFGVFGLLLLLESVLT